MITCFMMSNILYIVYIMATPQVQNIPNIKNLCSGYNGDYCNMRDQPCKGPYEAGFCQQGELNRLREDHCYILRREYDARKPLKYMTYQYRPFCENVSIGPYIGPNNIVWHGYSAGPCGINVENDLLISKTNMTKHRFRKQLPNLRPNFPRIRGGFDADIESDLIQSRYQDNSKDCKPVEQYIDRFQYFEHLGCPGVPGQENGWNPNAPENTVQKNNGLRGGVSTRNALRSAYMTGEYCRDINTWKI